MLVRTESKSERSHQCKAGCKYSDKRRRKRVLTMDLHCAQIQGFFDIPVDNLVGSPLLTDFYIKKFGDSLERDFVAVSPDLGSVTRVRKFAEKLNIPIAIIDKRRPKANVSEVMNIIGDIKGKKVILLDDMIDTAGTITNAANALIERGAIEVDACCTHGVLSGPAIERIEKSAIKELLVLDTIELPEEKKIDKITMVSVADISQMQSTASIMAFLFLSCLTDSHCAEKFTKS